jgi:hypothetical protein
MAIYEITIAASAAHVTVKIRDDEAVWVKPIGKKVEFTAGGDGKMRAFSFDDKTVEYSVTGRMGTGITIFVQTTKKQLPLTVEHNGTELSIESPAEKKENIGQSAKPLLTLKKLTLKKKKKKK